MFRRAARPQPSFPQQARRTPGQVLRSLSGLIPSLRNTCNAAFAATAEERRSLALRRGVALWDVLEQCDIEGAADSAIKNPVPNDIASLLRRSGIKAVFTTGKAAARLYPRFCVPAGGQPAGTQKRR